MRLSASCTRTVDWTGPISYQSALDEAQIPTFDHRPRAIYAVTATLPYHLHGLRSGSGILVRVSFEEL